MEIRLTLKVDVGVVAIAGGDGGIDRSGRFQPFCWVDAGVGVELGCGFDVAGAEVDVSVVAGAGDAAWVVFGFSCDGADVLEEATVSVFWYRW